MKTRRRYRLFIWHAVLADYTSGIAAAVALDADHAKRVLLEDLVKNQGWAEGDHYWRGLKADLDRNEPEVRDLPAGTSCSGGG